MLTLVRDSLLQAFYPYLPQMSSYCAACPWYGHHLPMLEASANTDGNVI